MSRDVQEFFISPWVKDTHIKIFVSRDGKFIGVSFVGGGVEARLPYVTDRKQAWEVLIELSIAAQRAAAAVLRASARAKDTTPKEDVTHDQAQS